MALRARPAAQAGEHLVDLDDDGADVAEVGLHGAAAEVFGQGVLELLLVGEDGGFQPLELLDAPADGERLPGAEESPLGRDNLADAAFGVPVRRRLRGGDGVEDLLDLVVVQGDGGGVVDGIGGDHRNEFLVVAQAHGRGDGVQAALRQQVPDGGEEALGRVRIGRILARQGAVPRDLRVFLQAGLFLEFQHGQEHQGDGFPVGQVVFRADAVGEGVDIARQLRVDGVAAVHRRPAHAEAGLDVLRGFHHLRQIRCPPECPSPWAGAGGSAGYRPGKASCPPRPPPCR